jgi:hypothetical protein
MATMWLFAYRPLQWHPDSPVSVNMSHPGILYLAVQVVEKAIQVSVTAATNPFRWFSSIWVQWHALAVMIAELCVQTEGPTVERAWAIVDAAFDETAQHIADSDKGRLWRPIKKLMNKAQAVRRKHLEDATPSLSSLPHQGVPKSSDQPTTPLPTTRLFDANVTQADAEPNLLDNTFRLAQCRAADSDPALFNWDQWLATNTSAQMDHNNSQLDKMAWTNWEAFIDDFQANGDFPSGQQRDNAAFLF